MTTSPGAALAALDLRVRQPETGFCDDEPAYAFDDREWLVSVGGADHEPVPTDSSVTIGLRNKFGTDENQRLDIPLEVLVLDPGGEISSGQIELMGDDFANIVYPSDFPGASQPEAGAYTIQWRASDEEVISCFGFQMA